MAGKILRLILVLITIYTGKSALAFVKKEFQSPSQLKSYPTIPDFNITTGHFCTIMDIDFIGYRYDENIPYCERNVSYDLKQRIYDIYNIPENKRHNYTIDHVIPLALGGSNDFTNLWPEHYKVKDTRKNLEYELYLRLKQGEMSRGEVINIIIKAKFNRNTPW